MPDGPSSASPGEGRIATLARAMSPWLRGSRAKAVGIGLVATAAFLMAQVGLPVQSWTHHNNSPTGHAVFSAALITDGSSWTACRTLRINISSYGLTEEDHRSLVEALARNASSYGGTRTGQMIAEMLRSGQTARQFADPWVSVKWLGARIMIGLLIVFAALVGVARLVPAVDRARRRRGVRAWGDGTCPSCRYPVPGADTELCPECGCCYREFVAESARRGIV